MADGMLPHIRRPIPDLSSLPQPVDREERLKIILANLEKQQQDVRASILAEARQKLESLRADEDTNMDDGSDMRSPAASNHRQFAANMSAPYIEGSGDPCLLHGTIPTADPGVMQAAVPIQVQITQHTLEQMDAYDKHGKQTRDYYVKALQRQQASRGDADPMQASKTPVDVVRDPRRRPTG